jgi:large subunit ribosomal protein L2
MAVKTYRPVTSTLRFKTSLDFSELTKTKPTKALLRSLRKSAGATTRPGDLPLIGGGHKRRYRVIDFRRDKFNILAALSPRVRSEPIGLYRSGCLSGRRSATFWRRSVCEKAIRSFPPKKLTSVRQSPAASQYAVSTELHNIELNPGPAESWFVAPAAWRS